MRRNPVIVIPGFMGSKLSTAVGNQLVWLSSQGLLSPEQTLAALRFDAADPDRLVSSGILDEIPVLPFFAPDVYKSLSGFLRGGNLKLRVLEFHYDWRKSIREAGDRLASQIRRLRAETGAPQVDLVAHSFGGLVARACLAAHSQGPDPIADSVGWLITLGAPHKGATRALQVLALGVDLFLVFRRARVRDTARTFPGLYELLPHDAADGMFQAGGQDADPYRQTGWATPAMQPFLAAAAQEVSQLLPSRLPVDSALIYATRTETVTVADATAAGVQIHSSDNGDGTVAEVSARGDGITGTRTLHRFQVPQVSHSGLLANEQVQQKVLSQLLLGRPLEPVQMFAAFESEPVYMPHRNNLLAVSVCDLDGRNLPGINVRLTIRDAGIDVAVPQTPRGDYAISVRLRPNAHLRYQVTASGPGISGTLRHTGQLVGTS